MSYDHIKGKHILLQLKADLIGKDSHRGVSLTYSWLANQFGHFALGFIPTLVTFAIFQRYTDIERTSFWAAITVSVLWFVFETYNFLGPLLIQRRSVLRFIYFPSKKKYSFRPAWGNIAFDTFTDLCFFWFGAFSASIFLDFSFIKVYILVGVVLLLILPARYWYRTKMFLQFGNYPFQFRLSQWDFTLSAEEMQTVRKFLDQSGSRHLLIYGGNNCGKSSLGVGIATEFSIKHQPCYYTTAMKLFQAFSVPEEEAPLTGKWTWRSAQFLVIDDINPGNPIKTNIITTATFLSALEVLPKGEGSNKDDISKKKVIWILGNNSPENDQSGWGQMLQSLGVDSKQIFTLSLDHGKI